MKISLMIKMFWMKILDVPNEDVPDEPDVPNEDKPDDQDVLDEDLSNELDVLVLSLQFVLSTTQKKHGLTFCIKLPYITDIIFSLFTAFHFL